MLVDGPVVWISNQMNHGAEYYFVDHEWASTGRLPAIIIA